MLPSTAALDTCCCVPDTPGPSPSLRSDRNECSPWPTLCPNPTHSKWHHRKGAVSPPTTPKVLCPRRPVVSPPSCVPAVLQPPCGTRPGNTMLCPQPHALDAVSPTPRTPNDTAAKVLCPRSRYPRSRYPVTVQRKQISNHGNTNSFSTARCCWSRTAMSGLELTARDSGAESIAK